MALDASSAGRRLAPVERRWEWRDTILYALGVGAGTESPQFTTQNSAGVELKAVPTLAFVLGEANDEAVATLAGVEDFSTTLHAEQRVEFFGPVPTAGHLRTEKFVSAVYDKGRAAILEVTADSFDSTSGELLFRNVAVMYIPGAGGFGGDRGPSRPPAEPGDRPADETVTYRTRPDQALIYRLSGDYNPLHSDPARAAELGYDRPILHGLCTLGFACRALVSDRMTAEPGLLRTLSARFVKPVLPGEELIVSMWRDQGAVRFDVATAEGSVVVDGGRATYA